MGKNTRLIARVQGVSAVIIIVIAAICVRIVALNLVFSASQKATEMMMM